MTHSFQSSLAYSESYVDAPWWERVYRLAFPSFSAMSSVRADGWAQRGGIDRVIILKSGKTLSVDEKVRSREYNDICLEYRSNDKTGALGWVAKDLACDYIAYAFVQSERCYMLPFQSLRRAWKERGNEWMRVAREESDGFRIVPAKNEQYTTWSVAVPIDIVLDAVRDAAIVDWGVTNG